MAGSDTEATVMLNVVPGMNTGITAFNAGLSSINAQFQNLTDTVYNTFGIFDAMVLSSGAMIAQFGLGAADAFGQFEQGMKIVQAVSQQSGEAIGYLTQQAEQFSIQYRTDIDSITEGLQTLGRAGLNSAAEQSEVLEQGLQTAKLEGRELNGVLEEIIQNTALLGGDINSDQFGEQAEYLNNLLVGTSLSAPLDTHDISETLKYSGGMLAAAGGSITDEEGHENEAGKELIEDYMGAVAAFGQKGVKGSIAGTALRAFFNKPATQDKSVVEALSSIGLAPEDLWNDEETMKPVSEQIGIIQRQMEAMNVSKMDQMQLWSKIVGGKMGQQMMKLDSHDIQEMTADIQQSTSAESLANQTFDTYNQKMAQIHEQSQKLFRDFGEHIVIAMKPALEIINKILDVLNNPMFKGVGFAGFIFFVTTLSHALRAGLRVLQRFKQELTGLLLGPRHSWNPDEMLAAGHKGAPAGYMRINRPSQLLDNAGYTTVGDKTAATKLESKKKAKQDYFNTIKQNIAEISMQMDELILAIDENFSNLDMNVDINLDDLKNEIQSITSSAVSSIKTITEESNASAQRIKQNVAEVKAAMSQSTPTAGGKGKSVPVYAPLGPVEGEITVDDIVKDRKTYTKKNLAKMLIEEGLVDGDINDPDSIGRIANKYKKPELAEMAYPIVNKDIMSDIMQREFMNFQMKMVQDFPDKPHQWVMDKDGGYYNLRGDDDAWVHPDMDKKLKEMEEKAEEIRANAELGALFPDDEEQKTKSAIRKQKWSGDWADEIDINTGSKEMDDFIRFQLKQKELFPDMPHQWVMDEDGGYVNLREDEWSEEARAKAAAEREKMHSEAKQALDMLFDGVEEAMVEKKAELAGKKYWGGLTEEEFNQQYYDSKKAGWQADKHNINYADEVSEKTRLQIEQYLDSMNQAEGELVVRRNLDGDVVRHELRSDYEASDRDIAGLSALFGEGEAPERSDRSYAKKVSAREKVTNRFNKAMGEASDKLDNLAKTVGSEATSKAGKVVDLLGGKFSAALIGATALMEAYNYMFGQWQKSVQEHQQKISEAENKVADAENEIRKSYQEANPNATQEEIDNAVNDAYVDIAENGYQMGALDENTQALLVATSQLQQANALLAQDTSDNKFGRTGLFTETADAWQQLVNQLPLIGNWGTQVVQDTGEMGNARAEKLLFGYNTQAGSILDNHNKAVLTGSQESADYPYSKEDAAIFADDVFRATQQKGRDAIDGLFDYFGTDAKHFQEVTKGIFKGDGAYGGSSYDTMSKMVATNFGDNDSQFKLQMALKNYQKDFQKIGKQMRKFEKANKGRTALSEFSKKGTSSKQALKNIEVKDKDLYRYIRSLSIKTGLSEQKILMAAQLQQMQDLNQIMTDQVQPQVLGIATNAYQQLAVQQGTKYGQDSTASGANSTAVSAAAIAAKLSVMVEQALDKEMVSDYIARGGTDPEIIKDPSGQVLKSRAVAAWNKDESQRSPWEDFLVNHYMQNYFKAEYLSGWDLGHPNATQEERDKALTNYWNKVSQYDTFEGAINATRQGANDYYTNALLAAYDSSDIGEGGGEPSGGSGGGGGGDSDGGSDKDNTGTKKERVDLVLCNKKEIPKLNVNLFKKAPQFTVLNKNFKLRDIKINTQDKPKAVLDSIKNAIIDTQRRMDPKIIQDEEAEYDPVAATDGNSTPTGSTSTTADNE